MVQDVHFIDKKGNMDVPAVQSMMDTGDHRMHNWITKLNSCNLVGQQFHIQLAKE